jgi:hypothetical protein
MGGTSMDRTDQAVSQLGTVILFLAGVAFLGGGLIFLCAAVQNTARLPIALALAAIGVALAAWAGLRWQRARQLSPEVLDDRITVLAASHDAELSLAQVVSELKVPDEAARAALARLEAVGLCTQEQRNGQLTYIFPGLKERKVVRRCSYCGSEYSVREPLTKCTNCGGTLEIVKT